MKLKIEYIKLVHIHDLMYPENAFIALLKIPSRVYNTKFALGITISNYSYTDEGMMYCDNVLKFVYIKICVGFWFIKILNFRILNDI